MQYNARTKPDAHKHSIRGGN